MPFIKIWIHLVWSTKNRQLFLTKDIRQKVFSHMMENARTKDIYVDFINGYSDHAHCLISLNKQQTISQIVQLIKGESSHWINKNQLCKEKFQWQEEYFAVSVSESIVNKVREYIKNQEAHHAGKTYEQEYIELIEKYGFPISPWPKGQGNS